MKLSNVNQIKTTILGIVIILADLYYWLHKADVNSTIFFGVLVVGIALLFLPDTLIGGLKALINKNKDNEVL